MATTLPRQWPYPPSSSPDGPVAADVDIERRPPALDAGRPAAAGFGDTWPDYAAACPPLEEFWPATDPARRARPSGLAWHITSLGEWEAAGMVLGDGPTGPEAIAGAIPGRSASRRLRRHRASADSLSWSGEVLPALSDSRPNATRPRQSALGSWWSFYLLLCGPFLAFRRVRWLHRAIPRTLLVVAAVIGVLVTAALVMELQQRSGAEAPAQAQPAVTGAEAGTGEGAETQPPLTVVPTPATSAVSVGGWVVVANTDGQGLYLRRQPNWSSKWVAWGEGTKFQVLAAEANGTEAPRTRGEAWLQVQDPEGRVGYVPEQYVALAPQP